MANATGELEAISRLLSDLSGQLHKTQDPGYAAGIAQADAHTARPIGQDNR
jgi:hypothetical protein